MKQYIVRRLIYSLLTIIMIATVTFFMMHSIPGGPFTRERRPVPPEIMRVLNEKYHLDDPLWKQYVDYMKGLFTFDLGPSFSKIGTSVNDLIISGFSLDGPCRWVRCYSDYYPGSSSRNYICFKAESADRLLCDVYGNPGSYDSQFCYRHSHYFRFFQVNWGGIPPFGLSTPASYIGPVVALSGYSLSFVARLTRSSMLEVLRQDYVRTARANGLRGVFGYRQTCCEKCFNLSFPGCHLYRCRQSLLL